MNTPESATGLLARSSLMPVSVGESRPLTQEDMNRHALRDPDTSGPFAPLRSIRNSHHMLARMLAEDRPGAEISSVLGYSTSRIKILEEDPSIKELVVHYRAQHDSRTADIATQVQNLTLNALQELAERLELEPEEFSKDELLKLVVNGLDRIGHGPSSKVNVSGQVDVAGVIAMVKTQSEAERARKVLSRDEAETLFHESQNQKRLVGQST
jgi:hypothetical protein